MNKIKLSKGKTIIGSILAVLSLSLIFLMGSIVEEVDAGEIVVIQRLSGELRVYTQPGYVVQMFGKVTHYKRSNQYEFFLPKEKDGPDNSIEVKWNDGGKAQISGSVRYDLPTNYNQMVEIHKKFGSQRAVEEQLVATNVQKAVTMSGPLMTSKESYAEKKNDLIFYLEDQASKGVYKTKQVEVKEIDPITEKEKSVTRVQIQNDANGSTARQEKSPLIDLGIRLYNISINKIKYDDVVEKQILTQQQATMQVQTAIAKAKEAEQRALTIAKEGEADAAKAKWDQEVIKAKTVTEAESRKAVAALDVQTAELQKRKLILEGEGEAAKKRAAMLANGALEQKLEAWVKVQGYWANAFQNYTGSMVPAYNVGGNGGNVNAGTQFQELMMMKAARDLGLEFSPGKTK
jgi:regulator of protease activity HflC (stomatin/prohibitin superfamily)